MSGRAAAKAAFSCRARRPRAAGLAGLASRQADDPRPGLLDGLPAAPVGGDDRGLEAKLGRSPQDGRW